ncbi:MAG: type II toxin-antitoxin system VapC family toxin [Gammaproteobacteria bacterium]
MKLFFDTSAFAKRYVTEGGTIRVLELCQQADSIGLSVVCLPELISTLCRLVRERKLTQVQYAQLKRDVLADIADMDVCMVTASVLDHTITALEGAPLRAMDAIHIGCALDYQPDVFVSADHRQVSAAQSRGLRVEHV